MSETKRTTKSKASTAKKTSTKTSAAKKPAAKKTATKKAVATKTTTTYIVVNCEKLRVRTAPSLKAEVRAYIPAGATVEIIKIDGEWAAFADGYLFTKFLKKLDA